MKILKQELKKYSDDKKPSSQQIRLKRYGALAELRFKPVLTVAFAMPRLSMGIQ